MRTSKPVSTISYNSYSFLRSKLDDLRTGGILSAWAFVAHKGELDEVSGQREKDHFHVWIELAKTVQTEELRKCFSEADFSHPDKPLGVMPFQSSKLVDWYLYGLHDPAYLARKGMQREFQYLPSDMVFSEYDYFSELLRDCRSGLNDLSSRVQSAAAHDIPFYALAASGCIPLAQLRSAQFLYECVQSAAFGVSGWGADYARLKAENDLNSSKALEWERKYRALEARLDMTPSELSRIGSDDCGQNVNDPVDPEWVQDCMSSDEELPLF